MLISINRGDEQLTSCARVDFSFQVTNWSAGLKLKWTLMEFNHVDFIVKKASKKLYSLRILCGAGVTLDSILVRFI